MKGILRSFVLVALAVAVMCAVMPADAQDATGGLRYSITVTKFENQAGWHGYWDIGDAWGTVLTDMLNQTGRFIVLGETDMRAAALDEQDFAASGRRVPTRQDGLPVARRAATRRQSPVR